MYTFPNMGWRLSLTLYLVSRNTDDGGIRSLLICIIHLNSIHQLGGRKRKSKKKERINYTTTTKIVKCLSVSTSVCFDTFWLSLNKGCIIVSSSPHRIKSEQQSLFRGTTSTTQWSDAQQTATNLKVWRNKFVFRYFYWKLCDGPIYLVDRFSTGSIFLVWWKVLLDSVKDKFKWTIFGFVK